jgi:hypothetical protein
MSEVVIIVVVGLGIGAAFFLSRQYEKRRTEKLRQVSMRIGLTFQPKGDKSLIEQLSHFNLFSQGRSKKIKNMFSGQQRHTQVAIFGYKYTTGSGKHTRTHQQTVMYCQASQLNLPGFALRPENIFHKVGKVFGYKDIDFTSHPTFSKKYLLRGDDEDSVRRVFEGHVLSYFENQPGVCAEGRGDQLIVYRPEKRVKPEEIHTFIEDGFRVLEVFK